MIVVAKKKYKTKKELELYVRDFLEKNEGKFINLGESDFNFLFDLIKRHPDYDKKIIHPIYKFTSLRNFGGHIALSLYDKQGEKSISWKKCVSGNKSSWKADLKAVCRNEVTDQIQDYKDKNYFDNMNCPSCNKRIPNRKAAHVDHKTKSFKEIFDLFLGNNFENLPKEFESAGNHLGWVFKDEDWFIKKAWSGFHNDIADYQILCSVCNIKKN